MYIHITQTWIKRLYNLDSQPVFAQPVFAQPSSESMPNTMYVRNAHHPANGLWKMTLPIYTMQQVVSYILFRTPLAPSSSVSMPTINIIYACAMNNTAAGLWNMTLIKRYSKFFSYLYPHPGASKRANCSTSINHYLH